MAELFGSSLIGGAGWRRRGLTRLRAVAVSCALATVLSGVSGFLPAPAEAAGSFKVVGTGKDGLYKRTGPGAQFPTAGLLSEGSSITVVCQTHGSRPLAASDVWDKLADGTYVYDYFTTTPGRGVITQGICPPAGASAPAAPEASAARPGSAANAANQAAIEKARAATAEAKAKADAANQAAIDAAKAKPTAPAAVAFQVVGTGKDGLYKHTGPGTQYPTAGRLAEGTTITVVCQTHGSRPRAESDVWDKLADGTYIFDYFTTTPGRGVITLGVCAVPSPEASAARPGSAANAANQAAIEKARAAAAEKKAEENAANQAAINKQNADRAKAKAPPAPTKISMGILVRECDGTPVAVAIGLAGCHWTDPYASAANLKQYKNCLNLFDGYPDLECSYVDGYASYLTDDNTHQAIACLAGCEALARDAAQAAARERLQIGIVIAGPFGLEEESAGAISLYHGTTAVNALKFLNGMELDEAAAAAGKARVASTRGFFLATSSADAEYYALRRAPGSILRFDLSNNAMETLAKKGAVIRPIPGGPVPVFEGREMYIPPSAFQQFNELRALGEISAAKP